MAKAPPDVQPLIVSNGDAVPTKVDKPSQNGKVNPYPRTWIEIDLTAMEHNLAAVREHLADPKIKICLVAKADAYGHGLLPVTRFALQKGADWAAVATVQEGIALRDAGIHAPILVLSPILPVEAEQAVFYKLRVVVERFEIAQALNRAAAAQQTKAIIHLEVDTGIARFGCYPEETADLACQISALEYLHLEGLCHHFADSRGNPERTREQETIFKAALETCESRNLSFQVIHASNSAGAIWYPESRYDMVRLGLVAYGLDPYGLLPEKLKQVMTWKTRVASMRGVPEGSFVGYCGTYQTPRSTKIATLGVGYGDGYPRILSNRGYVLIQGQKAPIRGLICMDQMLIDVSDLPEAQVGDEAVLIGAGVPAEELARLAETNTHEIVTRILPRVPRRYSQG